MDVHRDFCEIAICEQGAVRSAGRIDTDSQALELFACSLAPTDRVALEATGNALAIARILEPHIAEVIVADARPLRAMRAKKAKTDRIDARALADLLDAGMLNAVWIGDEPIRALRRRLSRRAQLVRQRTRAKNEVHGVLQRNLKGRPPVSDIFGKAGRRWLAGLDLPVDERQTRDGCVRQVDFLEQELRIIDRAIAEEALARADIRRLMTIPGVDVTTAAALVAAIGDIRRFPSPRQLVSYLGLDPTVRQSGSDAARHGRISKQGNAAVRAMLVEAAWQAARAPGPLRAFAERVGGRRGKQIAAVAVARKLTVLVWHLLTRGEDYAFARPSLTRQKLRRLELRTGARQLTGTRPTPRIIPTPQQRVAERELAEKAEASYRRLMTDWTATGARTGAGATPGRASKRPSKGKAARQTSKPQRSAL